MAKAIAESKLFGIQTPAQALALGLLCQAEGRHPAEAARDYHIINGKPSLKSEAMLARFQQAGGKVDWHEYTHESVSGTFSHPQGGSLKVSWTMQDATRAGLTGNPTWKKFPRQMLKARCISEAVRGIFPGVLSGLYAPEEVGEFTPVQAVTEPEPLQIEAPVTSACQHKGCWMTLQDAGANNELFVRFLDYSFFVPKDLAGKTAVIKGNFYQDTTSVEDLRHYAEDEGLSAEEVAQITEPKVEYKFYASGVYVKE